MILQVRDTQKKSTHLPVFPRSVFTYAHSRGSVTLFIFLHIFYLNECRHTHDD